MSAHSAVGLVAFVAAFTAAGAGVLIGFNGVPTRRAALADLGLAYVIGTAALGSLLTFEVIVGLPFSPATITLSAALIAGGGVVAGRRRHRVEHHRPPQSWPGHVAAALFVALAIVLLEAFFRSARLQGLYGWDAGSFWVPKAHALFAGGGLDETHFMTLPGPSYPPLVPVLQASAFEFMGSADVIALHLLYWTFVAGFVAAAMRLLLPLASGAVATAAVLLVLSAHAVVGDGLTPQADVLLDVYVGLAVVAVARWLARPQFALLLMATTFLVAAVLTKREGLLLTACIGGALIVANGRRWRRSLPAAALLLLVPASASIPWRVWFTRRSLPGDGPEAGLLALFDHLDRVWPATTLVLETVTDPRLWSVAVVVMLLAATAALLVGDRTIPIFCLSFATLALLGFVWVMWSFPSLPLTSAGALNPIPRLAGGLAIPAALLSAVLVQHTLDRLEVRLPRRETPRLRLFTAVLVGYVAVAYPAGVLAFSGLPRFPAVTDCAALAARGEPFLLVYAHRSSLREALSVGAHLTSTGFVPVEVRSDGCGRWEVVNPDVETLEQARGHTEDARRVGVEPRLERP